MKTLVIMPTYNEAENLPQSVAALFIDNPEVDLLVVDDGSPDGTAAIARSLQKTNSRIFLLERTSKQGLGPAYLAGFEWAFQAGYEYVVEMDADGSHRGQDLPKLLEAAANYDLVIGSRWIPGGEVVNWPLSRKLISRIGNGYARNMLGTTIRDMTAGFRVFRVEFLKSLNLEKVSSQGYSFQVELAYRAYQRGRVYEVPIVFIERTNGKSKMTLAIVREALAKVTFWGLKRIFS